MDRIIGEIPGKGKKQLLIAIAAMHGNEPAGIAATERVLDILRAKQDQFKGRFIAIKGNVKASNTKRRYLKQDLNRIWTDDNIAFANSLTDFEDYPEHEELLEIHGLIANKLKDGYDEVTIIDLHTTSANGGVFIACNDEEIHKNLVRRLHVPVILNLAKDLEGTAMQYYWDMGHLAFAFEGGNHYNPESVNNMESALWLCLEYMGMINRRHFSNIEFHDRRLIKSTEGLPHFCLLVHHHPISTEDEFVMKPGYVNFQHVTKGEVLAIDRNGEIRCPQNGRILMPLYQPQGTDGYFLVEELN
ncbi:MAG: succinylglutamate desuccinylase/aspartoacylase family protein [Bacteroidetes bacterium]|nr:succinylglutamate desuccinylase/aspartoacylase family protein [Bacteroidota bacterium]